MSFPSALLSRDVVVANTNAHYLGSDLDSVIANLSYRRFGSKNYAVAKDHPDEKLVFRAICVVDDHFAFLSYTGNINTTYTVKTPEGAKYSGFLKMVPSGFHNYEWAAQDWGKTCNNLASIQQAAATSWKFQNAMTCVYGEGDRRLMKITLPLFHSNINRRKAGDEAKHTFADWPKTSQTLELFEKVEKLRIWDINPLPVYEKVDGSWVPVVPECYHLLKGCLVDLEFSVAFTPISVNGKGDKIQSQPNSQAHRNVRLSALEFDGNVRNGRKLTFWAVPTAIRILDANANVTTNTTAAGDSTSDTSNSGEDASNSGEKRRAASPADESERQVKRLLSSSPEASAGPSSSSVSSAGSLLSRSDSMTQSLYATSDGCSPSSSPLVTGNSSSCTEDGA